MSVMKLAYRLIIFLVLKYNKTFHQNERKVLVQPVNAGFDWWSRRESNPRPQILHNKFYILSHII
jgi:hypothetical protein